MKIRGDIESVNLSTGERHRRVSGDGESKLESEGRYLEITPEQLKKGYVVLEGILGLRRDYVVLRGTPQGTYIVIDPNS